MALTKTHPTAFYADISPRPSAPSLPLAPVSVTLAALLVLGVAALDLHQRTADNDQTDAADISTFIAP